MRLLYRRRFDLRRVSNHQGTAPMNILVVEPHADDAFLSLGAHMEKWVNEGNDVTIATIYSGTKGRGSEAAAYAKAIGADWFGLGASEVRPRQDDPPECATACADLRKAIAMLGSFDTICLPVGIRHPEHRAVRKHMTCCFSTINVYLYMEQPYSVVSTNHEELMTQIWGRGIHSYMKPHMRKWRHIPIFKSQAKFFHFNPAEDLHRTFEMLLEA